MPSITIVAIDSLNYKKTAFAINKTRDVFPEAKVLTLSPIEFYSSDKWVKVEPFDKQGHSKICLHEVADHVDTDFALFVQFDGFPINKHLWTDDFFNYDYIGAPWEHRPPGKDVGNGGFSLRSKKLLTLCKNLNPRFDTGNYDDWLEDQVICVHHRPWLESYGIKFAPKEVAEKFSREHPEGYADTFGFHGIFQVKHFLSPDDYKMWDS